MARITKEGGGEHLTEARHLRVLLAQEKAAHSETLSLLASLLTAAEVVVVEQDVWKTVRMPGVFANLAMQNETETELMAAIHRLQQTVQKVKEAQGGQCL